MTRPTKQRPLSSEEKELLRLMVEHSSEDDIDPSRLEAEIRSMQPDELARSLREFRSPHDSRSRR